jgi:hypothetical protein
MCCQGGPISRVVHGAAGLVKVAAQAAGIPVDQADAAMVKSRLDKCRVCPHSGKSQNPAFRKTKGLTSLSKCDICGCFLGAKARIASESCPDDPPRWTAIE